MTKPHSIFLAAAVGAAILVASVVTATESQSVASATQAPVALNGTDLVSYFQGNGKPVNGVADIAVVHDGKKYLFATNENAEKFKADPAAFLPQYGGHCAWATAQGRIAPGDPAHYRVVDGKLYLNYNAEVQARWIVDVPGFIAKANANWPTLKASIN